MEIEISASWLTEESFIGQPRPKHLNWIIKFLHNTNYMNASFGILDFILLKPFVKRFKINLTQNDWSLGYLSITKRTWKVSFDITALRRESPESKQKFQYRECQEYENKSQSGLCLLTQSALFELFLNERWNHHLGPVEPRMLRSSNSR